ncbi:hypothetical protein EKH79_03130 [Dyella dinghuensis]|uniref:Uncharacterized protein n=1 Tax=Dyella dinghuensis TaxID=1920169 RepID=A0A432LXG6_9GAMM|nr:hypothetical protein [Dyella dinghuensis]RUL66818.1 hypothetical protein EKH79_03130 [Dyella dinghuensis]
MKHQAHRMHASGQLEGTLRVPPNWTSIERLIAASSTQVGASYGKLQALERVANSGSDPTKVVRRIPASEWEDAGIVDPAIREIRKSKGEEVLYAVIKLNLVECAEKIFQGSSDWYNTKIWDLLNLENLSPRDVEQITEHCLKKLGLFRTHLVVHGAGAFSQKTAKDYVFSTPPSSQSELVAQYKSDLFPLTEDPTADGLSLLASMLFEASYLGDELLVEIHGDLLAQALTSIEKRPPLGEAIGQETLEGDPPLVRDRNIVGILASAIFDAAAEFAERSLPPIHRMSLALPPRRLRQTHLA